MIVRKYCIKAIIRYLNGDMADFAKYKDMATNMYKNEYCFLIKDLIPKEIKEKLYKYVS